MVEGGASRSRERSLRDQAGASATWAGVLVDLAEQSAEVVVSVAGTRRAGRLVGVGPDYCVLEQRGGRPAIVVMAAIASVTPLQDRRSAPSGARPPALELSLAAALGGLADERAPVGLCVGPGEVVDGELIAAGEDVVTVQSASRTVHVPLRAVLVCELR